MKCTRWALRTVYEGRMFWLARHSVVDGNAFYDWTADRKDRKRFTDRGEAVGILRASSQHRITLVRFKVPVIPTRRRLIAQLEARLKDAESRLAKVAEWVRPENRDVSHIGLVLEAVKGWEKEGGTE